MLGSVEELSRRVGVEQACNALEVSCATYYRWREKKKKPQRSGKRKKQAPNFSLTKEEREKVIEELHSERFMDMPPRQVYAALLDEGTYLCSVRTMYRILEELGEVNERRKQVCRKHYQKPELIATSPNQVWSWDITKLKGPEKWNYFYLYVIIDIYSRCTVGWMIASRENGDLAKEFIEETCRKQNIAKDQLTIHSDRGGPMKCKTVAQLLLDLEVTKSHSRPRVSNDNPFSESQFKTLKYRPEYPKRFGSIEDARAFCRSFFSWYNTKHYHGGIALLTPEAVHYNYAPQIMERRQQVLDNAYTKHPQRFRNKIPSVPVLPKAVWINPPDCQKKVDQMLAESKISSVSYLNSKCSNSNQKEVIFTQGVCHAS